MPLARIAVVVPTYRRETRLRFALEGLVSQTLAQDQFEVVVVRPPDAPTPFAEPPEALSLRYLTASAAGPAAQRNEGWRSTEAPLVAFMDDDCRPSAKWLESLLLDGDLDTVLQGHTEPDPDESHLLVGLARTMRVRGKTETFPTCNIVYPRRVLEELDGFDESFREPWGEDTDLGQRAVALGTATRYSDAALVWHAVLPNPLPDALRGARRRRWLPAVIARHPRLRKSLVAGLFVNRAHATITVGLLGSFLLPRATRRLAWLPYLHEMLAGHARAASLTPRGLVRFALHLPVRLAIDLVEVASTVEGAARARSPVI